MLTFDSYMPTPNRYLEVSLGGSGAFSWNITKTAPWIQLSSSKGSVDRSNPDTKVEVSIDWSQVTSPSVTGTITIFDTAAGFYMSGDNQEIFITANKTAAPASFHGKRFRHISQPRRWLMCFDVWSGHVEGDGGVSIEAPHASSNTTVEGVTWSILPGYGKTVGGIKPLPVTGANGTNFAVGSGPSVVYDFYTFRNVSTMTTYIAPSMNANGNDRQLKFAVQIDSESPQTVAFMPIAAPGGLPAGWDTPDGFAANSIVTAVTNHTDIGPGAHKLTVWMIEPAVVLEKFVINTGNVRPSYLGPPESVIV